MSVNIALKRCTIPRIKMHNDARGQLAKGDDINVCEQYNVYFPKSVDQITPQATPKDTVLSTCCAWPLSRIARLVQGRGKSK